MKMACVFFLFLLLAFSCTDPDFVELTDSLAARANAHGKEFGTSVVYNALFNTEYPALAQRYRDVIAGQFSFIVPESEMNMAAMWVAEDRIDFSRVDRMADWAIENGLKMRAHVLVWHRSLPAWLVAGYNRGDYTAAQVSTLVQWYITEVMTRYKTEYPGLINYWEVVNETIGPNDPRISASYGLRPPGSDYEGLGEDFWRLTLGDDYASLAFQWARAADAEAKLLYNDYHDEYDNPKGEAIYAFVTGMKANGVPIDGIGLQCHFSISYLDMSYPNISFSVQSISNTVDRWIAAGLEVLVTEADVGMTAGQEQRQAGLFADVLGVTILKTGVPQFTTWGFTDRVSWREEESALYFDENMNPKDSYYAMLRVLQNWSR